MYANLSRERRPAAATGGKVRGVELLQIPFSHNCLKVRRALELKRLDFTLRDVSPLDRAPVRQASGQGLVPVLVDGADVITDSTAILLHLESRYPEVPLLPADPAGRAECLLLEDWADAAFMEMTRRLAYAQALATPGAIEGLFFPGARGLTLWLKGRAARRAVARRFRITPVSTARDTREAPRRAALAMQRLGGGPYLMGDRITIADITLAAMASPLTHVPRLRSETSVAALLGWSARVLGKDQA